MNEGKLQKLLDQLREEPKENEFLEFKHNNDSEKMIGERLSGLANSACYKGVDFGYLVFGIENETHNVVGTTIDLQTKKIGNEDFKTWMYQRLSPKIAFEVHQFPYQGKQIAMIQVPAAIDRPIRFEQRAFIRIGSANRNLNDFPDHERAIWNNKQFNSFESQTCVSEESAETILKKLDYPSLFRLIGKPLPIDRQGILESLIEEKMIAEDHGFFSIKNLGALLLGHSLSSFPNISRKALRIIVYKGKDRTEALRENVVDKGYAIAFQEIVDYVDAQIPSVEDISDAIRTDKKQYPKVALRELIANALIHQDFLVGGMNPKVEIFSDRVEIINPGVPLIDVNRLIDSTPRSRNEQLASFMRRVGVCEERGSGLDKVVEQVELSQLPAPDFTIIGDSTKVTLYSYRKLSEMNQLDRTRACYQHCVLRYISTEKMTNASLRKRFNIDKQNYAIASRIIKETIESKLVKPFEPSGSKKHAKYVPFWA